MLHDGCWIFLSHASKDIALVRRVRNEFEKYGQNPLAFHLRCLDENYPEKNEELWNLIYREIDAREWFVYCKSPISENSENVLRERKYIEQSGKDKIWILDITEDWDTIATKIYKICADLKIFISYSYYDYHIAKTLQNILSKKDYSVWTPEDNLKSGDCWTTQLNNAISQCAELGFYILLISDNTFNNQFIEKELEYATAQGAWIVPIIIGDAVLPQQIRHLQYFRVSNHPSNNEFEKIIKVIDKVMLKKIHDISKR